MKKIIALLLALIMTFSMGTVAFATDTGAEDDTTVETTPDGETSEEDSAESEAEAEEAGDFDWLLDLPFWTVKPALKFAKIALKFAKIYVKLGIIFGWVDKNDIISQIQDLINGSTEDTTEETEETEEVVPEETAPEAA